MSYYSNTLYVETDITTNMLSDNTQRNGLNCASMIDIPEHRSGWNYVKRLCVDHVHDASGPIMVDFVEKMWCWKDETATEKDIYYDNRSYVIPAKDVKMMDGKEYAVLNENTAVYWNGEEWVLSDRTYIEVVTADTYGVFTQPWVGIVHNPVNMPHWFDYGNSPQELVKKPNFQKSMAYCKGLIVFSEDLKRKLATLEGHVPIHVLTHPTEPVGVRWNPTSIRRKGLLGPLCWVLKQSQPRKRLVQVGYWLRKLTSIWEVSVPDGWTKYWINRAEHGLRCLEKEIYHEQKALQVCCGQEVKLLRLSNLEYDEFLRDSVMFIDLYDSSCNNTILEAIVRHVPIVTRRLPATEEYLGTDYVLFFDSLETVPSLLSPERLLEAHNQLKMLEASGRFYGERFIQDLRALQF